MEPARNRRPEIEPEIRPKLRVIEGGGESTPERAKLRDANATASTLNQAEQRIGATQGSETTEGTPQSPNLYTRGGKKKSKLFGKGTFTRRRSLVGGGLVGIILSGFFGLSLLSPSLLLVQLKETLTDKFNDQLAVLDARQTLILKKKLSTTTTKGICTPIKLRCKYQTLGDRHIKRLQNAGITVEGDKTVIGRTKPTTFNFNGEKITAGELLNKARSDPDLRSALRHGYNPKFAAFSDGLATKILSSKLGIVKSSSAPKGGTSDDMKEHLASTSSGKTAELNFSKFTVKDGKYYDEVGNEIDKAVYDQAEAANATIKNEVDLRAANKGAVGKTLLKSGLKGALLSTAFGLGAADTFCSAWNLIRATQFAAKVIGARQLIRYSYEFLKSADMLVAGDATPEQVSAMGEILTSVNAEGKSATDSYGYRYAAYGDIGGMANLSTEGDSKNVLTDAALKQNEIADETTRYISGSLVPDNAFSSLLENLKGNNPDDADDICGFVKSGWGQALVFGTAVAGAFVAFFTVGTTGIAGAAAQVGAMATVSVALAMLAPKLAQIAAGKVITGGENGNQAGNAIVSGMGALNSEMSKGRGLAVLTKSDAIAYGQKSIQVAADYAEVERAERSPFDPTSRHTFIGSIVSQILPSIRTTSAFSSIFGFISGVGVSSLKSIDKPSKAADFNAKEFEICKDWEYTGANNRNLAADPYCNLRYGLSDEALATDPEVVLSYMLTKDSGQSYINEENGTPLSDGNAYAEYIKKCINREVSIGGTSDDLKDEGDECIQGKSGANEERNMMFRLFYIDNSVIEGMDEPYESEAGNEETQSGPFDMRIGTFNIFPNTARPFKEQLTKDLPERMKTASSIITGKDMDVVGLQEIEPEMKDQLDKDSNLGATYSSFPKNKSEGPDYSNLLPIYWKSEKYELKDQGYIKTTWRPCASPTDFCSKAPWVKLRVKYGEGVGREFFVTNDHLVNALGQSGAKREATTKSVIEWAKGKDSEGAIFYTGDFNSSFDPTKDDDDIGFDRSRIPYCLLTTELFIHSFDSEKGRTGKCPTRDSEKPPGGRIDHVYVNKSSNITFKNNSIVGGATADKASDHLLVFADASFPGNATGDTGEIAWPVDKKFWDKSPQEFLQSHNGGGNFVGGPDQMSVDISGGGVVEGTPVYAMASGTVTKRPLGRSSRQCIGTPNGDDNGGLMIESKVQGGTLLVAYGHGKNVTTGSTVSAGEKIMEVGNVGNSCGAHLHIDMLFNRKGICPQDAFIAMGTGQTPDFTALTTSAVLPCGRTNR